MRRSVSFGWLVEWLVFVPISKSRSISGFGNKLVMGMRSPQKNRQLTARAFNGAVSLLYVSDGTREQKAGRVPELLADPLAAKQVNRPGERCQTS